MVALMLVLRPSVVLVVSRLSSVTLFCG